MIRTEIDIHKVWEVNTDEYRKLNAKAFLDDVTGLNLAESKQGLDVLCAVLSDNTLLGLDPKNGEIDWIQHGEVFDSPNDVTGFHPFPHSDQDGFLYVLDKKEDGILEVDIDTGNIERRIDAGKRLSVAWTVGDTIFGKYNEKFLVAYDLHTGEPKWEKEIPEKVRLLGKDRQGVYVSSRNADGLFVLNPENGDYVQHYDVHSTPTDLTMTDDTLYFTLWDEGGSVVSQPKGSDDLKDRHWKVEKDCNEIVYDEGQLILTTRDSKHVIALDASTGKELWRHEKQGEPTIRDYDLTDSHVVVGYRSSSVGFICRESGELENLIPFNNNSINFVRASPGNKIYVADNRDIALLAPK